MNAFAICKAAFDLKGDLTPSFWSIVKALWIPYWPWILIGLVIWVAAEIGSRNGRLHYNSRNGFSPTFNRVVGAGTYILLQAMVYLILKAIFGLAAYCHPWAHTIHCIVFVSTKWLLRVIRFWVY